jgi:hypothetical protein
MHKEIAKWLYDKIMTEGDVYQSEAVDEIVQKFGAEYSYDNELGNPAIDRKVLSEFRKLKGNDIAWDPSERFWHKETDLDKELKSFTLDLPEMPTFPKIEIEPIKFDDDFELK